MSDKPVIAIPVIGVSQMVVSAEPSEGATISLQTAGAADVQLIFSLPALSELEAMLARAAEQQAKSQPKQ